MLRILVVLLLVLLLSGCEGYVYGVPRSTWLNLSPGQKQEIIRGYHEREIIWAQHKPLSQAIDAVEVVY